MNSKQMQMSVKIWNKLFDLIKEIQLHIYQKANNNEQLDIVLLQNALIFFCASAYLTEPNIEYDFNLNMRKIKGLQDDLKRYLNLFTHSRI